MKKIAIFAVIAALVSFSSCEEEAVLGCTNTAANNYNASATEDDGSCTYTILGCMDASAMNYNAAANIDDGSCTYYGDAYAGTYSVEETCVSGPYDYEQVITSNGNSITLVNAFGWSDDGSTSNNVTIELSSESFNITGYSAELDYSGTIYPCEYDIQSQIQGDIIMMIYTIYVDQGEGLVEYDSCEATLSLSTGGLTSPTNPKSFNL